MRYKKEQRGKPLDGGKKYGILDSLIEGGYYKDIAEEHEVAPSTVHNIKHNHPLFFWRGAEDED